MSNLTIPDKTRNNYRLTGIGCVALNESAFTVGTRNIAGGHLLKIGGYEAAQRRLTVKDGEMGKLAPGMVLYLWTCADDDNSPHELKIASVDVANRTVTLTRDLPIKSTLLNTAADWIGAVVDQHREAAAFASGDWCFAPGEYATASGAVTMASGFGAHAEGVLCEARGDMSMAGGNMTVAAGLASVACGSNTRAGGMFATAIGASTVASGDNSIAAGTGSEAAGDSAVAIGFRNKAAGRGSMAAGMLAEALGDYSVAIGRQVKNHAKSSVLLGVHGELPDTVENTGAFALPAGNRLPLLIQGSRAISNPLYGQPGEPATIATPDFAVTIGGHLLPVTETVAGSLLVLDHGRAGRWKVTPGAAMTPQLKNWRDGDRGELVVYNGGSKILFPAAWRWVGSQPTLKTAGFDVFTIYQIDNTIFIKHEVTA